MSARVRGSTGRRLIAYFCLSLIFVLAAVLTGLGLGRIISSQITPTKTASAPPQTTVLQDSAWLSEAYWRKRRQKKLRSQTYSGRYSGFNPFGPNFDPQQQWSRYGGGGTVRTVCVRLCDGYYFPISFSTTRSRLGKDEQACRSRCSGDARLYFYRTSGGSPETMVDRRGNAYADLKTAFQYRTRFDKSCQCRPEPWSKEARERHALYATKDWQKQSRRLARLEQRRARRNRRLPETGYQPSSTLFGATPQGGYLPGVAGWQQQPGTGPDMVNSQPRMALGNRPRSVKRRRSRQPRSIRRSRKQWRTNAFSSQN